MGGGVRRDCTLRRVCTSEPSHIKVSGKAQRLTDLPQNLIEAGNGGVIALPTRKTDKRLLIDQSWDWREERFPKGLLVHTDKGLRD